VLEDTRALEIDRAHPAIRVVSDRGALLTKRVVIATGAWLPFLVPAARSAITVVPQTVAYFRLGVPARSLPSWVYFDGAGSGVTYGLAEVGRDAIKVGHHVTQGTGTDPDAPVAPAFSEVGRFERGSIGSSPPRSRSCSAARPASTR
jgi:glycine/D-amino acid oxidase-like deaminating enzyme